MTTPPPIDTDPAARAPETRDGGRGGRGPAFSPWLIIGVIALVVAAAYVLFALL